MHTMLARVRTAVRQRPLAWSVLAVSAVASAVIIFLALREFEPLGATLPIALLAAVVNGVIGSGYLIGDEVDGDDR